MPEDYGLPYFKKYLNYRSNDGCFLWKESRGRVKRLDKAGTINNKGYLIININGKLWQAHRLVWLFANGEFPEHQIDHIDGNKLNNCIYNLRDVTNRENNRNKSRPSNNSSGVSGVFFHKKYKKYYVTITGKNGFRIHLGQFNNLLDAAAMRLSAEKDHGYHINHGR